MYKVPRARGMHSTFARAHVRTCVRACVMYIVPMYVHICTHMCTMYLVPRTSYIVQVGSKVQVHMYMYLALCTSYTLIGLTMYHHGTSYEYRQYVLILILLRHSSEIGTSERTHIREYVRTCVRVVRGISIQSYGDVGRGRALQFSPHLQYTPTENSIHVLLEDHSII